MSDTNQYEKLSQADIETLTEKRTDVRYPDRLSEVLPKDEAASRGFAVKRWPVMGELDDPSETNALGFQVGGWYGRGLKDIEEKKRAEEEARLAAERAAAEPEPEPEAEPQITVEELEQIRASAFNEGHDEGFAAGHDEGYAAGVEEGKKAGFDEGQGAGYKTGFEEGTRRGREEGFRQGHAEGLQSGEQIVVEQAERFRHLADCLANPLRQVDRDVTDELVYMVSRLAAVIIGREIKGDAEYLKSTVTKALSVLPNYEKGAVITLNPDDASVLEAAVGREYMQEQHWDIKTDASLQIGDVRVTNEASEVQWRINDRIDALLGEFLINAAPGVEKALHEEIPDAPAYDEVIPPLAQPTLEDLGTAEAMQDAPHSETAAPQSAPQPQVSPQAAPAQQAAQAVPPAPAQAAAQPATKPTPKPAQPQIKPAPAAAAPGADGA
ncbi:MAG: hypothetical protein IJ228_05970 [Succinivibrio sp.]|nr:hypothetical protein [Succinivibrio sp.]